MMVKLAVLLLLPSSSSHFHIVLLGFEFPRHLSYDELGIRMSLDFSSPYDFIQLQTE